MEKTRNTQWMSGSKKLSGSFKVLSQNTNLLYDVATTKKKIINTMILLSRSDKSLTKKYCYKTSFKIEIKRNQAVLFFFFLRFFFGGEFEFASTFEKNAHRNTF